MIPPAGSEPVPPKRRSSFVGILPLILLYLAVVYLIPRPESVAPAGWRLFGLFVATVAGLILQPLPGGALVLVAVAVVPMLGGLTVAQSLSGYADATVWLVMAAFFISRALMNTGLARRIALFFVRLFGGSSLGICYALSISDSLLATIIPSIGARSGGIILPIVRSVCELYGSKPGPTAAVLGSFLFTSVYQSMCISAAMFLTGQASNPLAAKMAGNAGYPISWLSWFIAGSVPGIVSLLVVPLVVLKLNPPGILKTPEASQFANAELRKMGPMSKQEWILAAVFAVVCTLWVTSGMHGIDITSTALFGSVALLLTGVLTWDDVKNEKAAWDIFIWYGGLLMLGKALNDAGVTTAFAKQVGGAFGSTGWPVLFGAALLIYFYAHYGFASITAHMLAMYPAFLAVLLAKGAPIGLMVFSFACFACLSAGLTNYGTTPAPMYFAHDYVSLRTWWRVGVLVSFVNLLIWGTVGFAWWKVLGIW